MPQVFFNENLIEGSKPTLALLDQWDKEAKLYSTPLSRYQTEIESKPEPSDTHLALPITATVIEKPPPPRNGSDKLQLPNGEIVIYKNFFNGSTGTSDLMNYSIYPSRRRPSPFLAAHSKREISYIMSVTYDHDFDNNQKFYRLQPY